MDVPVSTRRTAALRLSPAAAMALLADVPAWGRLFPRVATIAPLDPDVPDAFVWTMEPIGPPGVAVQTVYGCHYTFGSKTVAWTPIDGVGNARFSGQVAVEARADGGADLHLALDSVLTIPAPAFIRPLVVAAVSLEFGRMMDAFAARLESLP